MQLRRARRVLERTGPFTTVRIEVSRDSETSEERLESQWTNTTQQLGREGVPEALVADIAERVRTNTHLPGEVWRTIVAAGDEVVLDEVQEGHQSRPASVDHGELPDLGPWLAREDQALPFVLAVVDRTGADLSAFRAQLAPPREERSVTGETYYITKVSPGDWAQKQFQQSAENAWEQNARLVADTIRSLSAEHGTRAVFVAGEVRARAEVLRALEHGEHQHLGRVVEVEAGGRGEGSSDDALWDELQEHVRTRLAEEDAELVARLEEARGRGEGAATGLDDVLNALTKAQVQHLVVDLDRLGDEVVAPADHPGLALPPSAADSPALPADRVLVAAAALTDAEVTLVSGSMAGAEGVAALLRWAETPPEE